MKVDRVDSIRSKNRDFRPCRAELINFYQPHKLSKQRKPPLQILGRGLRGGVQQWVRNEPPKPFLRCIAGYYAKQMKKD